MRFKISLIAGHQAQHKHLAFAENRQISFQKATTFIDSNYAFNVLEFYKDSHFLSRKGICIVLADPTI